MQNEAAFARIDDCLRRQIEAARRLIEQLRLEAAALSAGDAAGVEAVLAPKQAALQVFEALDRERECLLYEAGCGDTSKTEDWLAAANPRQTGGALTHWRQLLELAGECGRQNQINGQLIQGGLRHTRQVLELLSGRPPEEAAPYGPPQTRSGAASPGHSLGKA